MTVEDKQSGQKAPLLDRRDERVKHESGIGGTIRAFFDRVRAGDLVDPAAVPAHRCRTSSPPAAACAPAPRT